MPPPPEIFFGRDELVERIISLAEKLTPIALLGTCGIGKTSVILTALHDRRIKERFGDNRSFIRCDQFLASHTHFLRKFSEAIGSGVENPDGICPMRPYLFSKEMLIVLDNAESIFDLPATEVQKIYAIMEELSICKNICLVITSRISYIPVDCEIIEVPTLSTEAGKKTFYRIHGLQERPEQINEILKGLDFHPVSITLLANVAQRNNWSAERLTAEWEKQRTGILQTPDLGSLAAMIEDSLASAMFQGLGPDAREILGVVAFFPQGVNEGDVDRVFPTVSNEPSMFDVFCNLSLTYRVNGFVTMLAPLRDYLRPKNPMASPLLLTVKDYYLRRLSVVLGPGKPGFCESQWITSEDVNVEHLLDVLDVFLSVDPESRELVGGCM